MSLANHSQQLPLSHLQFIDDKLEVKVDKILDFEFENFGKLLQEVSSIGSFCLPHKFLTQETQYFLGEKLRIRRLHGGYSKGEFVVSGTAIADSKRKEKAMLDIYDKNDSLKYKLDMNVFSKDTFSRLLRNYILADHFEQKVKRNVLGRCCYLHHDEALTVDCQTI